MKYLSSNLFFGIGRALPAVFGWGVFVFLAFALASVFVTLAVVVMAAGAVYAMASGKAADRRRTDEAVNEEHVS